MSLRSRFWRIILRNTFKGKRLTIEQERARATKNAGNMGRIPNGVRIEKIVIDGTRAAWVCPASAGDEKVVLYLHGGGYVVGGIDNYQAMCGLMAHTLNMKVLLPDYRLAPEHPFPAALEDVQKVYQWLLAQGYQPANITIAGDSAGGGLSVATVLALRDAKVPLPAAVVCISPWADLTCKGQSHISKAEAESMLMTDVLLEWASCYAGRENLQNLLISPVYADFHDFPPLLIQVGSDEILLDDALTLAKKAKADGANVELKIWAGMWHVWHIFGDLIPESRQAFDEIAKFIQNKQ